MNFVNSISIAILTFLVAACKQAEDHSASRETLFTTMTSDYTGIHFSNNLAFDQKFNIYTYRNFYNGGGVAIGDINNDGLYDIYFTGNQVGNKLYLNKGDFKFEDVTDRAGVSGKQKWSTGVAMADVNGDGHVDIYVCSSGNIEGDQEKKNELFINNGDLTFTEKADEYGLAERGYSTHAAFFDYDKDGDLDLYLLNNSFVAIGTLNLQKNIRETRDRMGGHKLMRNDGEHFVDVSEVAGIYGSVIAFGLGVSIGDVDKDSWPDIFVSNDFFERDYLYINNRNGTFRECLPDQIQSITYTSMGADLADINNDGWPDLFVTDMLPKDNSRLKTVTTFEDWNKYQYNVRNGYHHQFTRNMLQINNGNGTFSEVGRLSGVDATDWSWGALIFDMDNDGLKDIFVANGIYQDLTNQDFLQFASNEEFVRSVVSNQSVDYKKLTEIIPSTPIPNFAFQNKGNLRFEDMASEFGLGSPGFSNGSAYADLDNDGDLDLVVNNVNMEASVYRNEARQKLPNNHYVKFVLKGEGKNTQGVGSKISVQVGKNLFFIEQMPIRGFQSSVDARPNLGLGEAKYIDRVTIEWPDSRTTVMDSVPIDQTITCFQKDADVSSTHEKGPTAARRFERISITDSIQHKENNYVDFDHDHLLYHMLTNEGPRITKGDVNNDGLDDFYLGGSRGNPGALFLQTSAGNFVSSNRRIFEVDKKFEDMGSEFFDADRDGDLDLYVASGGNEAPSGDPALLDRLYLNDGEGNFTKKEINLAASAESTSAIRSGDYDQDGDMDLFLGSRVKPLQYGLPVSGYILNNDGKGNFTDVTDDVAPSLKNIGMITDAIWADVDSDKDPDLMIVGEYMPISVFINSNGKLSDQSSHAIIGPTNGWWNRIEGADIDGDGDIDFVIANHGLNSQFKATTGEPVSMFAGDFDKNGKMEHIVTSMAKGKNVPFVLRHELINQLPSLKKKYLKYEAFKDQTIEDIFTEDELRNAVRLDAYVLETCILLNSGAGNFILKALPVEAQVSPVYGIEIIDADHDGNLDIILGGNQYRVKPQVGRYDASYGTYLRGDGKGNFSPVLSRESGLNVDGETRDIVSIRTRKGMLMLFARNNSDLVAYLLNTKK